MTGNAVTNVYLHVMDDVIEKMGPDFQNEGVNDSVLDELKGLWELKLLQTGAIPAPEDGPASPSVGDGYPPDLNVAFDNGDRGFGSTDLIPSVATGVGYESSFKNDDAFGKPDLFLANTSAYQSGRPSMQMDLNKSVEYLSDSDEEKQEEGVMQPFFSSEAKRQRRGDSGAIPQVDGSADGVTCSSTKEQRLKEWELLKEAYMNVASLRETVANIPQLDGEDDGEEAEDEEGDEEEEVEEDYNEPGDEAGAVGLHQNDSNVGGGGRHGGDEAADPDADDNEELGADDDDTDDDPEGAEAEQNDPETENSVLAIFDKVTRSKNKWKCVLKDGIVKVKGKDMLFVKASGEFEF